MYLKEEIRDHPGYQIDTNGVVYKKNGKPFKTSLNPKGYEIVVLMTNGEPRAYSVHRLVLRQFIPNEKEHELQVNHKDGVHNHNSVENLEWVTAKENMHHSFWVLGNQVGAKNYQAKKIEGYSKSGILVCSFPCMADAARHYCKLKGVSFKSAVNTIWRGVHGVRNTSYGLKWKYV